MSMCKYVRERPAAEGARISRGVRRCIGLTLIACASLRAQTPRVFSRTAWQADYGALKTELERNYSHLAWFGSPEGGSDLPSLDRITRDALQHAENDLQAVEALRSFVRGFHDGHLALTATPTPAVATSEP